MSYQDAISQSAPFTVLDGSFHSNAQSPFWRLVWLNACGADRLLPGFHDPG